MEVAALIALFLAALPAIVCAWNLRLYQPPPRTDRLLQQDLPKVSVLIPARNEENSIGQAVAAALVNTGAELEVIVMDDHSDDGTAAVVEKIARADERVRLEKAPALPAGWNGKQHACFALGRAARNPLLVFVDADVRLAPDAVARMAAYLEISKADLASGLPRQETGSFWERVLIPLLHFVLLGYLPMARMRRSPSPAYAAGCGQLFIVRRQAYAEAGGHAAIRGSMHDGIQLPRAFRRAGLRTDLFDAAPVATCRMYRGGRELWQGFSKNAVEGMASPAAIVPWTVLLLGGQVLPFFLLLYVFFVPEAVAVGISALAGILLAYMTRLSLMARFKQSFTGVLLHPLGILAMLAIQWFALVKYCRGRPSSWKGRQQQPA